MAAKNRRCNFFNEEFYRFTLLAMYASDSSSQCVYVLVDPIHNKNTSVAISMRGRKWLCRASRHYTNYVVTNRCPFMLSTPGEALLIEIPSIEFTISTNATLMHSCHRHCICFAFCTTWRPEPIVGCRFASGRCKWPRWSIKNEEFHDFWSYIEVHHNLSATICTETMSLLWSVRQNTFCLHVCI